MKKRLIRTFILLLTYPVKFFEFCIELYLVIVNTAMHLIIHRRLPYSKSDRFNDILFMIKSRRKYFTDPKRIFVTDKIFAKMYISAKIGEQYIVPTLLEIDNISALNDCLGTDFGSDVVIKPSHSCGKILIRRRIEETDRNILASWLRECYFDHSLEYYYRSLKPRILVEPLIFGEMDPNDYKFFCKKGRVVMIQVDVDRHSNHVRALYDRGWSKHNFSIGYPFNQAKIDPPENLAKMIEVAESVSDDFDYLRVDMYSNNLEVKIGELTNCHGNALERIIANKQVAIDEESKFFGN